MSIALENIQQQIAHLKKQNPAYKELLDFYRKIAELLHTTKVEVNVPMQIRGKLRRIEMREGFPLMNKNDFILDIPSSVKLFQSLCELGKNSTDKMKKSVHKIEKAIKDGKIDPAKLIARYIDTAYQDEVIKKLKLNKAVLNFLVHLSIMPSVHANVEKLREHVDLKNWLKGYCPVCGSMPNMSELRGEGQRHYHCSFCGFLWPGERLKCPFCENTDHKKLHYLYAEGQEVYRVDLCDKCKQYIKTVDSRKLDTDPDLDLLDIATIHLDIIAKQKGYKNPLPSMWGV